MKIETVRLVVVRYCYPEMESRPDGWGRLTRLSAVGGELLTRFRVEKGDRLLLSFELSGQNFDGVPCHVISAGTDTDGYTCAQIRFQDESSRVMLGRALRELFA